MLHSSVVARQGLCSSTLSPPNKLQRKLNKKTACAKTVMPMPAVINELVGPIHEATAARFAPGLLATCEASPSQCMGMKTPETPANVSQQCSLPEGWVSVR